MNDWLLIYEGFDPDEEGLREALCTLGNGYFATRGAWPESSADGVHYPGTYVAGCYNRLDSTRSPAARSRTRASSTCRTGCPCGSASTAATGSTTTRPRSSSTASSSTCAGAC